LKHHRVLMDHVALESGKSLNQKKLIGLYLDESGVSKKGKESVGVAPQYCGNLGKVDNCQVAVFAAIGQKDFSTIVDSRLYLPKSWTEDQKRMEKAKIPTESQVFKTKQQIALELIEHQISIGNRFDYINADALYGADQKLTDAIDELSIPFVMDIRENQHIFLEEPKIYMN
jgi:SRSO17 transposase